MPGREQDRNIMEELHQQGWEVVAPYFLKAQQEAFEQYRQFFRTERASNDIRKVIPAAYDGRVDLLFVAVGIQQRGNFDPDTLSVHLHQEPEPGDEDLLDFAALHTFLNGERFMPLNRKKYRMRHPWPLSSVIDRKRKRPEDVKTHLRSKPWIRKRLMWER